MANVVLMPQLGISEESAVLSHWHVTKGSAVAAGKRLFTLETGKSSFDVESEFTGTVLELLCSEGEELPIKTPICVIGEPGESWSLPDMPEAAKEAPIADIPSPEAPRPAAQPQEKPSGAASPRARALAEKTRIDISCVAPSGPHGRTIERDVKAYLDAGRPVREAAAPAAETPAAEYTDAPVSRVRRAIASNMQASLSELAQLTLNASFDAGELQSFRRSAKSGVLPGFEGVTINDLLLFAVSRTLMDFRYINAHWLGDKIRTYNTVNLGFACDTERGLMVPVIRNAERLSLLEISGKAKALAKACSEGTAAPADLSGASFTVSNLGSLGVESFTPVINPPEVAILGVCGVTTRVKDNAGAPVCYGAMGLSLTFDHRALDGAPAAKFLKALCGRLEAFPLLLAM